MVGMASHNTAKKHVFANQCTGAVAGLALLGFYNGLTGFCDILPDNTDYPDDVLGYPRERCELLLQEMRRRYPESRLLKLEEARMQSSKGNLDQAIQTLSGNLDSKMKQIKAFTLVRLRDQVW